MRRAGVALGSVLGVALVLAGCGSQSPGTDGPQQPKETTVSTPPQDDEGSLPGVIVKIKARVAVPPPSTQPSVTSGGTGRGLLVEYSVENSSSRAVLLVDRIPNDFESSSGGQYPITSLTTFVLAGPDATIDLSKRVFVPNSGPDFTVRYQGSVVEPGATVTGKAFAPFPLEHLTPGFATNQGAGRPLPEHPKGWRLCLGVRTHYEPSELLKGGKVARVANTVYGKEDVQRLLCTPMQPLPTGWDAG